MLKTLAARWQQKYRTFAWPQGDLPPLPSRFAGKPVIGEGDCGDCQACMAVCPTGALSRDDTCSTPLLDLGACLFCRACQSACPEDRVQFSREHSLATARRDDLLLGPETIDRPLISNPLGRGIFHRSLKLRQVSAGGCNACEADCNVLGTPAWDLGRFGIQFVASPRHADGLLVTGPVTKNMHQALKKTYAALPDPKLVIAVGACAISGGPYRGHDQQCDGVDSVLPVDLYIPGCPPHPLTILDGFLRLLGRISD